MTAPTFADDPARPVRVYVLPVSGGHFAVQLGELAAVAASNDIRSARGDAAPPAERPPALALASSGGNMAAYAGLASNWSRKRLYSQAEFIRSGAFAAGWGGNLDSVFLAGPFFKAMFRPGYGFLPVFNRSFTPASITASTEIWTGMLHVRTKQQQLLTNKAEGATLIVPVDTSAPESIDSLPLGSNAPPIYADGDLSLIARATLASASIPWFLPPVKILGEDYSDGGEIYASPLTVAADEVYGLSLGGTRALRITYFSPRNITIPDRDGGTLLGVINTLIYGMRTVDVRKLADIAARLNGGAAVEPALHRRLSPTALADLFAGLDAGGEHYTVVLFPDIPLGVYTEAAEAGNPIKLELNLLNLTPIKISNVMSNVEQYLGALVWEVPLTP